MLPLGMVVSFLGYGLGSWGWVLVRGYNITLREWFSPLHPYQGPLDGNGTVPAGHIFPTGTKSAAPAPGAGSGIQSNPPGVPRTAPNPHGTVQ